MSSLRAVAALALTHHDRGFRALPVPGPTQRAILAANACTVLALLAFGIAPRRSPKRSFRFLNSVVLTRSTQRCGGSTRTPRRGGGSGVWKVNDSSNAGGSMRLGPS